MRCHRFFAMLGGCLAVSACTPLSQASLDTVGAVISRPPKVELNRAQVEKTGLAQMHVDAGQLGSALMVLGRYVDRQRYWASASGQVLVEQNGLVRRMTGFPETLEGTHLSADSPFVSGLQHVRAGSTAERSVDWMPGYRYGVTLHSTFSQPVAQELNILGESIPVLYIEESLRAEQIDFRAINRYWVRPGDGLVLKSEQQLTPKQRVTITLLRQ